MEDDGRKLLHGLGMCRGRVPRVCESMNGDSLGTINMIHEVIVF